MQAGGAARLHVLVTRPAEQAEGLCEAIRARGAVAVMFPLLEIGPSDDPAALTALCDDLDQYDIAFFVSPNAVHHALDAILPRRSWPAALAVSTVGQGSAHALRARGFVDVIAPESGFDSEAVLALPAFQPAAVAGRRIIVFRGNGGRDLFIETLRGRGAKVDHVQAYTRRPVVFDPEGLTRMHAEGKLDVITLTSSEAVRHLIDGIGAGRLGALARLPVLVPHPRIGEHARAGGFCSVIETPPGDEGLLSGLESLLSTRLG